MEKNKPMINRRDFVKIAAAGVVAAGIGGTAYGVLGPKSLWSVGPQIPLAKGMLLHDPSRCLGCRRCELSCTTMREGKASPTTARVHLSRNYAFGPKGTQLGVQRGTGNFGNGRIIVDTCRQCPSPVPCVDACPIKAIGDKPPVNARAVKDICLGVGACVGACPWEMPTLDPNPPRITPPKVTKCDLCDGDPRCVKFCPTGAMQYVPWQDMTEIIPKRH